MKVAKETLIVVIESDSNRRKAPPGPLAGVGLRPTARWLTGSPVGLSELLRLVAERLGDLGIPYFITGSVASTYFGDLRFTNDIDIVVDLSMAQVDALCAAFVYTAPASDAVSKVR